MIDDIKNLFKNRPYFIVAATCLVICALVLTTLQGCNMASLIKVDVPPAIVAAVDAPDPVTLDNVNMVWEDWKRYVESNTNKFEHSISNAEERYAVLSQLTDIGLRTIEGEVSGIPGGTILLSALSLATGIFLKRPGEDMRVAKEKEDSYNKGLEVGSSITKT